MDYRQPEKSSTHGLRCPKRADLPKIARLPQSFRGEALGAPSEFLGRASAESAQRSQESGQLCSANVAADEAIATGSADFEPFEAARPLALDAALALSAATGISPKGPIETSENDESQPNPAL